MPFPHKTVLLTGATAGIGRALAERMIENGVFVIAVGRRKERLLELEQKYGPDKCVAEDFDVTDLEALPAWAEKITKAYPTLSSIILNAGIQRTLDFANPSYPDISSKVTSELTTNYTSPLLTITAFLPHLTALSSPASIILVTSGLAIVPLPRCANYCATKAALHSLAWSLRAQLGPAHPHLRVVEIMPPAVQTELHALQPELVAVGQADIGMPLGAFIDETWEALARWDAEEDEIMVKEVKGNWGHVEDARRVAFGQLQERMKAMKSKA
ncbi:hypothetical protein N0V93_000324 [Gnomoniopsis smithogilvyi]|uniref:Oxidoreductase n=1 Tax=Gnomoniopsis smithogilvyi TaxID=1191159 RepID=A0A9W9D045_9PEZI|nr:hypothetical protein N0V93_000324 [Gnomoniopsis smithogilvyi]